MQCQALQKSDCSARRIDLTSHFASGMPLCTPRTSTYPRLVRIALYKMAFWRGLLTVCIKTQKRNIRTLFQDDRTVAHPIRPIILPLKCITELVRFDSCGHWFSGSVPSRGVSKPDHHERTNSRFNFLCSSSTHPIKDPPGVSMTSVRVTYGNV